LVAGAPEGLKRKKGEYVVEIRDKRTAQSIVITHDEPLAGYHLDVTEAEWKDPKDHRVIGIAVGFRQVPRPPPVRPLKLGSTAVMLHVVQVPSNERNSITISLRNLLKHAGHP
jgi:hypothetical protein